MTTLLVRYVLPALLVIGLLTWIGTKIHDNGRTVEREKWQAIIIKEREQAQETLNTARKKVAAQAHQQQLNLAGVINEKTEKIENLSRDLHHATNRGLYISAKACPDNRNAMPAAASDTIDPTTRPARVRLPEADAARLRRTYELAQETVILYETCRNVVAAANVELIYPVGEKPND